MKIKQLLLFGYFFILPFVNYSQQWHQYSDSIISNIQKNNNEKASHFVELAEAEIKSIKVIKDTIYADYLYRKGVLNYYQSKKIDGLLSESLSIWDTSNKKNYFKIMKIHFFMGKNYIREEKYDFAITSLEKCYELNKKYKLKANTNFNEALYLLVALYYDKNNINKTDKYADEYITLMQSTAYEDFDFKFAKAYQFKKDTMGQESVLHQFLINYNQKQLDNPNLFFKINYELFYYYYKNNRLKETIKYGESTYEIYAKAKINSKEELKLIILALIAKYDEIGDNINRDKFKKLAFLNFPEDDNDDYYAELERLIKAEDFETFKVKFYEYEENLKSQGNIDDLFGIYALSIILFERNILFKKDEIEKQIEFIKKRSGSLSKENKIYFEVLLAEYSAMTNDFTQALKICDNHLNENDINLRLFFYKIKSICEISLAMGDAKKTAYKALEIANSIYGEYDPQLLPYLSLILTVDVMGQDTNATKISSKTIKIMYDNKLEYSDVAIGIWLSLGNSALYKKNLKDAAAYFEKSLRILESSNVISNPISYYACLLQLATVKIFERDFDSSLEYSNKVKAYLDSNSNIISIAYSDYYYQLGDFYFFQDRFKEAQMNYEKSFSISGENIKNMRKFNSILCNYFISDDVDKTINSLEKYQKESKGLSGVLKIIYLLKYNSGDLKASRELLVSQLKTLISDNNQYFHLLSDYEKEILYKGFSDQFEFLNTHLLANDTSFLKDYINFRFYSKSLLFSNSFKVDDINILNKKLYSELKNNTVLINKANESMNANLKETEDLKRTNREIEKILSSKNTSLVVPTLRDLTLKLKVNEAYVEIIRINKQSRSASKKGIDIVNQFTDSIYYGAIVIKKNAIPKFLVLDDTNLLESKYFPNFQSHIQGKNKLENDAVSYSLLFEKIETELNGIEKIFLVTDGVYNSINVESIYNPKKQQYLLDYLKIQLIQNVKSITEKNNELKVSSNLKASLFGNPDFKVNFNGAKEAPIASVILENEANRSLLSELKAKQNIGYLPGTENEIQSINSILKESNWSVDLYSKIDASEDNLKKIESPDILHIATHGFFIKDDSSDKKQTNISSLINETSSTNPYLKAGLLLSGAQNSLNDEYLDSSNNGILSAEEAKSLNLKNTELVVLSACETGLGENLVGEGVIGLQRAFMVAGAKSVIMSLWKVDDASTQKLMTLFYTNWIKNKMSKSDAFYAAKIEMKKTYLQPYYWAGFVLLE